MKEKPPIKEQEIEDYFASKGWPYKEVQESGGRHFQMRCPLPVCEGKRRRTFYVNVQKQGAWDCKRCGEHGAGLWSLRTVLGDTYAVAGISGHNPIKAGPSRISRRSSSNKPKKNKLNEQYVSDCEALLWSEKGKQARDYLVDERKLPEEVLRRFRIGANMQSCGLCVTIPIWDGQDLSTVKYRTVPPAERRIFRWAGTPSALYREPLSDLDESQPIIVVEGELDVLALAACGIKNVVSSTTGASGTWLDEWIDQLGDSPLIVLALDADAAGENGAQRLSQTIGKHRCARVKPPQDHKDWNDALIAGVGPEEIRSAVDDAEPYRPEEIRGATSFFSEIDSLRLRPDSAFGATTGWPSFDELIRGIRLNELTVLTGDTGSGKTTFCAALAWNIARNPGWPVLFAPFESRPAPLVQKWVGMEGRGEPLSLGADKYSLAKDNVARLPLYLIDQWGECDLPKLCASIEWADANLGVRFDVLDHLHFFLSTDPRYERQGIDAAMKRLSLLASDLGVHIFLVVHPRTTESDNERIGMAQLKGSSGIKQIASNVVAIWRHRSKDRSKKSETPKTVVTVLKCRADVGEEGSTVLEFDHGSCLYKEIEVNDE